MNNNSQSLFPSVDTGRVLDITGLHQHGDELKKEIVNAVKDTQAVLLTPLPDVLVMSPQQFDELDPTMGHMYQSKDRLYHTPLNVMEVQVKGEPDEQI